MVGGAGEFFVITICNSKVYFKAFIAFSDQDRNEFGDNLKRFNTGVTRGLLDCPPIDCPSGKGPKKLMDELNKKNSNNQPKNGNRGGGNSYSRGNYYNSGNPNGYHQNGQQGDGYQKRDNYQRGRGGYRGRGRGGYQHQHGGYQQGGQRQGYWNGNQQHYRKFIFVWPE